MDRQFVITVVTRGDDLEQSMPGGFAYAEQMFEEAGLRDPARDPLAGDLWRRLRILRRALQREFGNRVRVRVLSPWTPWGLWFVVRHRLRDFPCLVVAGRRYPYDTLTDDIVEVVRQALQ